MKQFFGLDDLSPAKRERLELLMTLIRRWSGTVNLVSRHDLPDLRARHVEDSLQLLPLLSDIPGTALDLGSGAGFPGLVLAIASDRPFHLVEADQRKAAFLREASRLCAAGITIHAARIETAALPQADLVTARALAPLPQLLAWAAPHLAPGGTCLFLKGRGAAAELTQAAAEWHMRVQRWPSRTDPDATILQLSEITRHDGR